MKNPHFAGRIPATQKSSWPMGHLSSRPRPLIYRTSNVAIVRLYDLFHANLAIIDI